MILKKNTSKPSEILKAQLALQSAVIKVSEGEQSIYDYQQYPIAALPPFNSTSHEDKFELRVETLHKGVECLLDEVDNLDVKVEQLKKDQNEESEKFITTQSELEKLDQSYQNLTSQLDQVRATSRELGKEVEAAKEETVEMVACEVTFTDISQDVSEFTSIIAPAITSKKQKLATIINEHVAAGKAFKEKIDNYETKISQLKTYKAQFPESDLCYRIESMIAQYEKEMGVFVRLVSKNLTDADLKILREKFSISSPSEFKDLVFCEKDKGLLYKYNASELEGENNTLSLLHGKMELVVDDFNEDYKDLDLAADKEKIEEQRKKTKELETQEQEKIDALTQMRNNLEREPDAQTKVLDLFILEQISFDQSVEEVDPQTALTFKKKYLEELKKLIEKGEITQQQREYLACYLLKNTVNHILAKERHSFRFTFDKSKKYSIQTKSMHEAMQLLVGEFAKNQKLEMSYYLTNLRIQLEGGKEVALTRHKKVFTKK